MGQETPLDEILAAIRRQKQLYKRKLENVHTIEDRNRLKDDIRILAGVESRILNQLKYDKRY